MGNEETVMSQAKPYFIFLGARTEAGRRFAYEWRVTPTGFSGISLASLWMLLKASLELALSTAKVEAQDSSPNSPVRELRF